MTRTIGKKQVRTLKLDPLTSAPTAEAGLVYFDDNTDKMKVCEDGSTFSDLPVGTVMQKIGSTTLGVAGATVSVSVPTGYRHLRFVLHGVATSDISSGQPIKVTINGLTTGYWGRLIRATVATFSSTSETTGLLLISDNTGCRNITAFGDISCPAGVHKRLSAEMHVDDSPTATTSYIGFARATQTSTAEVSSVEVTFTSNTFTTATTLTVYGIK